MEKSARNQISEQKMAEEIRNLEERDQIFNEILHIIDICLENSKLLCRSKRFFFEFFPVFFIFSVLEKRKLFH